MFNKNKSLIKNEKVKQKIPFKQIILNPQNEIKILPNNLISHQKCIKAIQKQINKKLTLNSSINNQKTKKTLKKLSKTSI